MQRVTAAELLCNLLANMLPPDTEWTLVALRSLGDYAPIVLSTSFDVPRVLRAYADYIELQNPEVQMFTVRHEETEDG